MDANRRSTPSDSGDALNDVDGRTVGERDALLDDPNARDLAWDAEHLRIPVMDEVLEVGTRVVDQGRVIVRKRVDEHIIEETVALAVDEVAVERVPVDRLVDEPIAPYHDGEVLVVPVIEEEIVEVVVRRQFRVVEELRITRRTGEREATVEVPVRRERVEVEHVTRDGQVRPITSAAGDGRTETQAHDEPLDDDDP